MALSQQALRKKREKTKQKRVVKLASRPMLGNNPIEWPIYECWVPGDLFEKGLGIVVLSRINERGSIAVASYLIDPYCLGVKDCSSRLVEFNEYQDLIEQLRRGCEVMAVTPNYVKTLIVQAVDYAKDLGFKPHADFSKAGKMLNGISLDPTLEFVFGKNGKPTYVQGGLESVKEARNIVVTLMTGAGKDNCDICLSGADQEDIFDAVT